MSNTDLTVEEAKDFIELIRLVWSKNIKTSVKLRVIGMMCVDMQNELKQITMGSKRFESVKATKIGKSAFDLSHEKKLSGIMGKLYPILHHEIVPGDSFRVQSEVFMRLAPMIAPIMHRINVFIHYFFVPNRIIFESWEDFITGGEDGLDATAAPTITMNNANKLQFVKGRLPDYFGIPPMVSATTYNYELDINCLPMRAYAEIWNEFYRDENLGTKLVFSHDATSGSDYDELCSIRARAWEKDYFTSAQESTQKGPEATVSVDFGYLSASEAELTVGGNPLDRDWETPHS